MSIKDDKERELVEAARAVIADHARLAITAAANAGTELDGDNFMGDAVGYAFARVARAWREHADVIEAAGRRGAKGDATTYRQAASHAAALAQHLVPDAGPYLAGQVDHLPGMNATTEAAAEFSPTITTDRASEPERPADYPTCLDTDAAGMPCGLPYGHPATTPHGPATADGIEIEVLATDPAGRLITTTVEVRSPRPSADIPGRAAAALVPAGALDSRESITEYLTEAPKGPSLQEVADAKRSALAVPAQSSGAPDVLADDPQHSGAQPNDHLLGTHPDHASPVGEQEAGPMTAPDIPALISPSELPGPAKVNPRPGGITPLTLAHLTSIANFAGPEAALRPAHRSPSQVDTYNGCGMRYQIQRYTDAPQRPIWSAIGGTAVHAVIERYELTWMRSHAPALPSEQEAIARAIEAEHGTPAQQYARAFGRAIGDVAVGLLGGPYADPATWYASNGGKEGLEWWQDAGPRIVREYIAARIHGALAGYTAAHVELETYTSHGGVAVKQRIDWAGYDPHGFPVIIDWKNGRQTPADDLQLKSYADAFAPYVTWRGDGPRYIKVAYWDGRKAELVSEQIIEIDWVRDELAYRYPLMDRGERAGIYPPNPSVMCVACPVLHSCPIKGARS